MDRRELRFRILFEYYNHIHSAVDYNPDDKVNDMVTDAHEIRAAKVWLVESGFVEGSIIGGLGTRQVTAMIGRINSAGINFVESVMDSAFTEVIGKDKDFDTLPKLDKLKKFAAECLHSPVTEQLCVVTYKAIVDFIASAHG